MNDTEAVIKLLHDARREVAQRDAKIADLEARLNTSQRLTASLQMRIAEIERRLAQLQEDFAASIEARTN